MEEAPLSTADDAPKIRNPNLVHHERLLSKFQYLHLPHPPDKLHALERNAECIAATLRQAVFLSLPQNLTRSDRDVWLKDWQESWSSQRNRDDPFGYYDDDEDDEPPYNPMHIEKTEGLIDYPDRDHVTLVLGTRRGGALSERDISEQQYELQFKTDVWRGRSFSYTFYDSCIHPHVHDDTNVTDPVLWAKTRAEIALGFAHSLAERDMPPDFVNFPFEQLASRVCNTLPEELSRPRTHVIGDARGMLEEIIARYAGELLPESLEFALSNREGVQALGLDHPAMKTFLDDMPVLLENGLIIDRVTDLVKTARYNGLDPSQAVEFAAALTHGIYSGAERPWWFVENFPMEELFQSEKNPVGFAWDAEGVAAATAIAAEAGFAFRHAAALFQKCGNVLISAGISQKQALTCCAKIAADYGVSDPDRARRIVYTIAEALKNEIGGKDVFIEDILSHLHRERPESVLIGAMGATDAHIPLPGMGSLMRGFLKDENARDTNLSLTAVEDLRKIGGTSATRLIAPIFGVQHKVARALLAGPETTQTLLPAPGQEQPKRSPMSALLHMYSRMEKECGAYHIDRISNLYFSFCATRFPDPFSPPEGFFSFLQKLSEIPDPGYRLPFLEDPYDRGWVEEQNAHSTIGKYSVLSQLLDTVANGVIPWGKLQEVMDWVTEEHDPAEEEKIFEKLEEESREKAEELEKIIKGGVEGIRKKYSDKMAKALEAMLKEEDWEKRYAYKELYYTYREYVDDAKDEYLYYQERAERDIHSPEKNRQKAYAEARSIKQETLKRRLFVLMEGVHILEELEVFRSAGIVSDDIMREATRSLLDFLLEGGVIDVKDPGRQFRNHQENIRIAEKMHQQCRVLGEMGLINTEVLRAQLDWEKRPAVAASLSEVLSTWERTMNECADMNQFLHHEIDDPLDEHLDRLEEELARIWSNQPLLKKERIPYVVHAFVPAVRYKRAIAQSRDLVRSAFPEPIETHLSDLSRSNYSVAAAITLAAQENSSGTDGQMKMLLETSPSELRTNQIAPAHKRAVMLERTHALREAILHARKESLGLLPVGGKIHVLHGIDSNRFAPLLQYLSMGSTSFRLIHADTSLLLPPVPSAGELAILIRLIESEGMIDFEHPELQVTASGRLPPEECAYLGSAILLSTERGMKFDASAFRTFDHDNETGARIMAYDAGARPMELPFMTRLQGRTDMLARRHLGDIPWYQRIATVLAQGCDEGPFAHLAVPLKQELAEVYAGYGLSGVLEAPWIKPTSGMRMPPENDRAHYEDGVKPCVDAYFASAEKGGEGVINDVREVLDRMWAKMSTIQLSIPDDPWYAEECKRVLRF